MSLLEGPLKETPHFLLTHSWTDHKKHSAHSSIGQFVKFDHNSKIARNNRAAFFTFSLQETWCCFLPLNVAAGQTGASGGQLDDKVRHMLKKEQAWGEAAVKYCKQTLSFYLWIYQPKLIYMSRQVWSDVFNLFLQILFTWKGIYLYFTLVRIISFFTPTMFILRNIPNFK